jgi:Zn-dependent peptidase ImmA (M78 family)
LLVAKDHWSGGVLPKPLPNGRFICILNPTHHRRRNKITLMEEIVHVYRKHVPTGLRGIMPGLRVREYNKAQEMEAYGVGAAVLLPWSSFYYSLNSGRPIQEMAECYDVTMQLIQYRIKITGATNLYRSRCKRP